MIISSVNRFGSRDCGFKIDLAVLDAFPEARMTRVRWGDTIMQEDLDLAMEDNHLQKPEYWQSATELYLKLKEIEWKNISIQEYLNGRVVYCNGETCTQSTKSGFVIFL